MILTPTSPGRICCCRGKLQFSRARTAVKLRRCVRFSVEGAVHVTLMELRLTWRPVVITGGFNFSCAERWKMSVVETLQMFMVELGIYPRSRKFLGCSTVDVLLKNGLENEDIWYNCNCIDRKGQILQSSCPILIEVLSIIYIISFHWRLLPYKSLNYTSHFTGFQYNDYPINSGNHVYTELNIFCVRIYIRAERTNFETEYFNLGGCTGPGRPIHTYQQREKATKIALRQNISLKERENSLYFY